MKKLRPIMAVAWLASAAMLAWPDIHAVSIIGHLPTAVSQNNIIFSLACNQNLGGMKGFVLEGDTVTVDCDDGHRLRCALLDNQFIC